MGADPPSDPFVAQELVETAYHVLWELVHVFFEHRGPARRARRAGPRPRHAARRASSTRSSPSARTTSTRCSPTCAPRRWRRRARSARCATQTLTEGARDAAWPPRRSCAGASTHGGTLLALGNGGSATDAMDAVADLRDSPRAGADERRPTCASRRGQSSLARPPRARPDRGPGDPDRDRQRRRRRGDVRAAGDRVRRARRRAAGVLDQRRLAERDRGAGRGAAARAASRSRSSATTAVAIAAERPRRPRDRDALGAHPAHPGGAGERLARAARADRAGPGRRRP